jgi:carbon storage regulator
VLVTSRRRGQTILVGEDIEITILDIHRNKVSIGIKAPGGVRIARAEIKLIEEQNALASRTPAGVETALIERLKSVPHAAQVLTAGPDT